MLTSTDHGPIRYFSLARSYAGRVILSVGVFYVDGLLIDSGPPNAHIEFASIIGGVDAEQLVLTHHHEDHIGNAAFAARHLHRPPLVHGLALALVRNPRPLPFYRKITWGSPASFEAEALGDTLHTRNHEFRVIHTPGHAPDHVALYEPEQRWLFTGDLFIAARLPLMMRGQDVTALIASLRSLLELPDCTMFCQHSGVQASHQRALGSKLDFLLGLQNKAVVMHEEGCTAAEITRQLRIENTSMKLFSGGEMSARNLVEGLLRDAGVGDEND